MEVKYVEVVHILHTYCSLECLSSSLCKVRYGSTMSFLQIMQKEKSSQAGVDRRVALGVTGGSKLGSLRVNFPNPRSWTI